MGIFILRSREPLCLRLRHFVPIIDDVLRMYLYAMERLMRLLWILLLLSCEVLISKSGLRADEQSSLRWPKRLEPGDTIMFIAPAGRLNRTRMELAKERLEARGYKTKIRDDAYDELGYLAGTDERRAAELMQAFADPEVDAIFPGTGGYGTTRILDMLDYRVIRENPKILIGFSDITGLHAALNKHAELVTFHSPVPMWGIGSEKNLTPFAAKYFYRAVEKSADSDQPYQIEYDFADLPVRTFGSGKARGRLTGGNLTLLAALEGTPHAIDTRDAILMIEDVGEAPYRIDRMLQQLESAGRLKTLRGAIIGQFTDTERTSSTHERLISKSENDFWNFENIRYPARRPRPERTDKRFTAEGVIEQYFEPLGIPVVANFPIGHYEQNCTLPLGGEVEVDATNGTVTVFLHP